VTLAVIASGLAAAVAGAADGDLDLAFDGDGKVMVSFGASAVAAGSAVAIDAAGRIVVAGQAGTGSNSDFAVFRLLPNGSLDTTGFAAPNGKTTIAFDLGGNLADEASAVAVQADGKILVAGRAQYSGTVQGDPRLDEIALVRLHPDGTPDASFGNLTGGRASLALGVSAGATDLRVLADGSILVVGTVDTGGAAASDWLVAKLTADGDVDTTWASAGLAQISFDLGGDRVDVASALAVQPDGRIVVSGHATVGSGNLDPAAARLLANGSLDPTFSGDGRTTIPMLGSEDFASAVALGPAGTIYLAGHAGAFLEGDSFVVRLLPGGALDSNFAIGGIRTFRYNPLRESFADALALQPDGAVVVAGRSLTLAPEATGDMGVARLLPSGTLDSSFSGNGLTEIAFDQGGGAGLADLDSAAAVLAPGGGIVVVGSAQKTAAQYAADAAVARLWISVLNQDDFESAGTERWPASSP
jgi:uncharacterized delta-60 repeat protein